MQSSLHLRRPDEFLQTTIEFLALSRQRLNEAAQQADAQMLALHRATAYSGSFDLIDPDLGTRETPRHHPEGVPTYEPFPIRIGLTPWRHDA